MAEVTENGNGRDDAGFIPALRFNWLTPLFDIVAAVTVRDGAIKRRVLACAGIAGGEHVLDVGCGTGTLAVAAAQAAPGVTVTDLDADASILARARKERPPLVSTSGSTRGDRLRFPMKTQASTSC